MSHLTKITNRAKQLKKSHPKTKWTNLVKQAARELKSGKVSGTKRKSTKVHYKKKKTMAKKTGRTVVVAGHKKTKRKHKRVSGLIPKAKMGAWDALKMLGGSIIGGSLGAVVNRLAPGNMTTKGLITLGVGGGGMMFVGQKHPFFFGIANGVGTAGGVTLAHKMGVIHGVEEMVSGIFDGMGWEKIDGLREDLESIPINTAGHGTGRGRDRGLHQGGYVGAYNQQEVDKWVLEGIPGMGGDELGWK